MKRVKKKSQDMSWIQSWSGNDCSLLLPSKTPRKRNFKAFIEDIEKELFVTRGKIAIVSDKKKIIDKNDNSNSEGRQNFESKEETFEVKNNLLHWVFCPTWVSLENDDIDKYAILPNSLQSMSIELATVEVSVLFRSYVICWDTLWFPWNIFWTDSAIANML